MNFEQGWSLKYINEERAIPELWRDEFYKELVSENQVYKAELEKQLKVHGVRWLK